MEFPKFTEVKRYRDMVSTFGGYNHRLSCDEGQFYDMKNMTSQYFPALSTRKNRGIVQQMVNPQGVSDQGSLVWMDDGILYIDGERIELDAKFYNKDKKRITRMGAYVIINDMWYNTSNGSEGYMSATYITDTIEEGKGAVAFTMTKADGTSITWHDAEYYKENEPKNGDYMVSVVNGKATLKVYSASTASWSGVTDTRIKINAEGIDKEFEKGDGVTIAFDNREANWDYAKNIFLGDEFGGSWLSTNTTILEKEENSITITGILDENKHFSNLTLVVMRKVPDMEFVIECNNRLWGCSRDGHEIYCCKLGDVKNWNYFEGLSTDSWAVTIGSDGKFTGAITYMGNPIFFKEDSLIKIYVSGTGAHQVKETKLRGVQEGSEKSLAIVNETLFYKSTTGVMAYTGNMPVSVSDDLGEVRYYDAVASNIDDRYYISMKDKEGKSHLFVYDTKTNIWCREDDTEVMYFCRDEDDLYYIDAKDNKMKSVYGTLLVESEENDTEGKFDWMAESGNIGYASPDNKYISQINIRIALEFGTNVDFYIQYDSSGEWEHKFNMAGKGTRTFSVPVIPKRCDHFKYKIAGKGGCKIYSITKTTEQGSDIT